MYEKIYFYMPWKSPDKIKAIIFKIMKMKSGFSPRAKENVVAMQQYHVYLENREYQHMDLLVKEVQISSNQITGKDFEENATLKGVIFHTFCSPHNSHVFLQWSFLNFSYGDPSAQVCSVFSLEHTSVRIDVQFRM